MSIKEKERLVAKESFSIKDLAHGLYLRDIINCMPDEYRLPYDETVYISIVKGVIYDYNEGLDEEKDGWFCSQHPQDDTSEKLSNLVKEDKRYASVCNMSDVYEWVIASALTVIQRRSK